MRLKSAAVALACGTAGEEATPLRSEFTLEVRDESDRLRGQHPVVALLLGSANDSAHRLNWVDCRPSPNPVPNG